MSKFKKLGAVAALAVAAAALSACQPAQNVSVTHKDKIYTVTWDNPDCASEGSCDYYSGTGAILINANPFQPTEIFCQVPAGQPNTCDLDLSSAPAGDYVVATAALYDIDAATAANGDSPPSWIPSDDDFIAAVMNCLAPNDPTAYAADPGTYSGGWYLKEDNCVAESITFGNSIRVSPTGLIFETTGGAPVDIDKQTEWKDGNGVNHVYVNTGKTMTYADAKAYAESHTYDGVKGHLATVTSATENAVVESVVGVDAVWLGLIDTTHDEGAATPRTWTWDAGDESGTLITTCPDWGSDMGGGLNCSNVGGKYSNWYNNGDALEPNNFDGTESAALMYSAVGECEGPCPGAGRWNDAIATGGAAVVVEFDGVDMITNKVDIAKETSINDGHFTHVYVNTGKAMTYAEAKDYAHTHTYNGVYGNLVTIGSDTENDAVYSLLTDSSAWLAYRDTTHDENAATPRTWAIDDGPGAGIAVTECSTWLDADGCTNVGGNYTNWSGNEPANYGGGETVAIMMAEINTCGGPCGYGGKWNDAANVGSQIVIVEFDIPNAANAPGAPTDVAAVSGDGQAVVSWTAPADNGGADIDSYTVTASPGGATCTATAPATSCTVSGLTNLSPYTFAVTAHNSAGTSEAATTATAIFPHTSDFQVWSEARSLLIGESTTVHIFGAAAGKPVAFRVGGRKFAVTADSNGEYSQVFAFPADPGNRVLVGKVLTLQALAKIGGTKVSVRDVIYIPKFTMRQKFREGKPIQALGRSIPEGATVTFTMLNKTTSLTNTACEIVADDTGYVTCAGTAPAAGDYTMTMKVDGRTVGTNDFTVTPPPVKLHAK